MTDRTSKGFTLIELMIAVAIMGILCTLALPFFASTIAKTQEGVTKVNLGVLRAALSIYYSELDGRYPYDASVLAKGGKYLEAIPKAYFPRTPFNDTAHAQINFMNVFYRTSSVGGLALRSRFGPYNCIGLPAMGDNSFCRTAADASGGWLYDGVGRVSTTFGTIIVSCTHRDLRGQLWSTY